MPGDDPGSSRRHPERGHRRIRSGDHQAVVQPIGVARRNGASGLAFPTASEAAGVADAGATASSSGATSAAGVNLPYAFQ